MIRILLILCPILFLAQSAEEIVQKNLEATGGYEAWIELQTVQIKGEITLGISEVYPIEIYQKRPDWTLSVIRLKGKKFILEGYNGKKAIQNDFRTGKIVPIAGYQAEKFDSDLLNYKSKGFHLVKMGTKNVKGTICYKIALKKHTNTSFYYFSKENYYLLREEKDGEIIEYSQFKKVKDLIFPYTIESFDNKGDTEFLLQVKSIVTNRVIPSSLFNF